MRHDYDSSWVSTTTRDALLHAPMDECLENVIEKGGPPSVVPLEGRMDVDVDLCPHRRGDQKSEPMHMDAKLNRQKK